MGKQIKVKLLMRILTIVFMLLISSYSVSAQNLQIKQTSHSETSVLYNDVTYLLAGTGYIEYSIEWNSPVQSILEAYWEINGSRTNIEYTIANNVPTFLTVGRITPENAGNYSAPEVTISYMAPGSAEGSTPITVKATGLPVQAFTAPVCTSSVSPAEVVFEGTNLIFDLNNQGGYPEGWNFQFENVNSSSGNKAEAVAKMEMNNAQPSVEVVNYAPDGKTIWYTNSIVFPVKVYSTPNLTLTVPDRTQYIPGESVLFTSTVSGGDDSAWTYSWTVNGEKVSNTGSSFNYTTVNTTQDPQEITISLIATNEPVGVNEPVELKKDFAFTVFGQPQFSGLLNHPTAVFNATPFVLNFNVTGGNPSTWSYNLINNDEESADVQIKSGELINVDLTKTGITAPLTEKYAIKVKNTYGDQRYESTSKETVITYWPTPTAEMISPEVTEYYNGSEIELNVQVSGGDPSNWTYQWSVEGQSAPTGSESVYNLTLTNNTTSVQKVKITCVATNAPEGIATPEVITLSYEAKVYPTPDVAELELPYSAVFNGTTVNIVASATGGDPEAWTYKWYDNGVEIGDGSATLIYEAQNTGSAGVSHTITLEAENIVGPEKRFFNKELNLMVWPTPSVELVAPSRKEWVSGESIPLSVTTTGGDASGWSFKWTYNGETFEGRDYTCVPVNDSEGKTVETIIVTCTNAPENINAAYISTLSFAFDLYPEPQKAGYNQSSGAVFNNGSVDMQIFTKGGVPEGWSFSWTAEGAPIDCETSSYSTTLTNVTSSSEISTFEVTAKYDFGTVTRTFNQVFQVTAWPSPEVSFDLVPNKNVLPGDEVVTSVTTTGGDADNWTFKWYYKGVEQTGETGSVFNKVIPALSSNVSDNAVIEVTATNTPDGIDKPYTTSLVTDFIVWPTPSSSSLTSEVVTMVSGASINFGANLIGGQDGEWTCEWTKDGSVMTDIDSSIFNLKVENNGTVFRTDLYTLTLTNKVNGEERYNHTYTYTVNVYPAPEVVQGTSSFDAYYGSSVELSVVNTYGYPDGWEFKWSESLPNQNTVSYTVPNSSATDVVKNITLLVTNKFEDQVWFSQEYTYRIHEWSLGTIQAGMTLESDYNGVLNANLTTIQTGGYTDGWTYEWSLNGNPLSNTTKDLSINESNSGETVETYNYTLVAVNTLNGVEGSRTTINFDTQIWPIIDAPTGFHVSQLEIANGETLSLNVVPQAATGGYNYEWTYSWTANGATIGSNSSDITYTPSFPANEMSVTKVTLGLRLVNPGPKGVNWFDETYPTQELTVYNRPNIPTQLVRKGNGTTCSLIVLTDLSDDQLSTLKYRFVFGYTDASGRDVFMPATADRLYRFSSDVYNNSTNDFWVYAVWNYSDGSEVTSKRRHLNGTVDDFNGSTFEPQSRVDLAGMEENWLNNNIYVDTYGFKVKFNNPTSANVKMFSIDGVEVFDRNYPSSDYIEDKFGVSKIKSGMYVLVVNVSNNVYVKKVLIK